MSYSRFHYVEKALEEIDPNLLKNLKLENCEMIGTDLAFEKSQAEATITTKVDSIKNPLEGTIVVPEVGEIIMDEEYAKGNIVIR